MNRFTGPIRELRYKLDDLRRWAHTSWHSQDQDSDWFAQSPNVALVNVGIFIPSDLDRKIIRKMRDCPIPIGVVDLATLVDAPLVDVTTRLVGLCASGPVVAIEFAGVCCYALEWGATAPWE